MTRTPAPARVILDADVAMGAPASDIDDGFAIALAMADPDMSVELLTTVNGNADVESATELAAGLLSRLGRDDVPVVRGAGTPLTGARTSASSRGRDPRFRRSQGGGTGGRAAVEIAERVMAEPGQLTVVAIGPLTNVALAMLLEPGVAAAVKEVVVMGGVFLQHTNLAAMPGEFNIWVDPDAAAVVFNSGAPIRCVGLDVTSQVRLSTEDADRMEARGGEFGAFAGACTREWIAYSERKNPGAVAERGSCAMHDPLTVAAVTAGDLLSWRPAHVAVETEGAVTRGVTVADLLTSDDPPEANCRIATGVDVDAFRELFLSRIVAL
jgi:purine nucleosidase